MACEIQPFAKSSQLTENCTPEIQKLSSVTQVHKREFGQSLLSQVENEYSKTLS